MYEHPAGLVPSAWLAFLDQAVRVRRLQPCSAATQYALELAQTVLNLFRKIELPSDKEKPPCADSGRPLLTGDIELRCRPPQLPSADTSRDRRCTR